MEWNGMELNEKMKSNEFYILFPLFWFIFLNNHIHNHNHNHKQSRLNMPKQKRQRLQTYIRKATEAVEALQFEYNLVWREICASDVMIIRLYECCSLEPKDKNGIEDRASRLLLIGTCKCFCNKEEQIRKLENV